MLESKLNGWLIRIDDKVEDTHLLFLTEEGNLLNLRAVGLQSEKSKNRMQLQKYSIIQIEYFHSEKNKNSGKLKKATLLKQISTNSLPKYLSIFLIEKMLYSYKNVDKDLYLLIEKILDDINSFKVNNVEIMYFIKRLLETKENVIFILDHCVHCGSKKLIQSFSFSDGGIVCSKCRKETDPVMKKEFLLKIIKLLSTKKFQEISRLEFDPIENRVFVQMLHHYITETFGLYVDEITKI